MKLLASDITMRDKFAMAASEGDVQFILDIWGCPRALRNRVRARYAFADEMIGTREEKG